MIIYYIAFIIGLHLVLIDILHSPLTLPIHKNVKLYDPDRREDILKSFTIIINIFIVLSFQCQILVNWWAPILTLGKFLDIDLFLYAITH